MRVLLLGAFCVLCITCNSSFADDITFTSKAPFILNAVRLGDLHSSIIVDRRIGRTSKSDPKATADLEGGECHYVAPLVKEIDDQRFRLICDAVSGNQAPGLSLQRLSALPRGEIDVSDETRKKLRTLPQLRYISLRGVRRIGGKPSGEIFRHHRSFPNLEHLNLAGTGRVGKQLRHLHLLPKLRHLNLATTDVSDFAMADVARIKTLHSLGCRATGITGHGLSEILTLPALTRLDISRNPIDADALCDIAAAKGLVSINMNGTAVNDQVLDALSTRADLTVLRVGGLNGSQISDNGLPYLSSWQTLRVLDLRGTRVTDDGISSAQLPESLEEVYLDDTAVSDAAASNVLALPSLRVLSLAGTNVSDAGMRHARRAESLEQVILRKTGISNDTLTYLSQNSRLELLDLGETGIDDEGVKRLGDLRSLRALYLDDTGVSDQCVRPLAIQAPRLEMLSINKSPVSRASLITCASMENLWFLSMQNCQQLEIRSGGLSLREHNLLLVLVGLWDPQVTERINLDSLAKALGPHVIIE